MSTIQPAVQALLDVFATDLEDVRFGNLDAGVLRRMVEETEVAAAAVADVQEILDQARATLADKQDELMHLAHRALAHARLHAEDHPDLLPRLDTIVLSRPPRREGESLILTADPTLAPRRRGRPRKIDPEVERAPDSTTSPSSPLPPELSLKAG